MNVPRLKSISLPVSEADKRISHTKSYLAKINGEWYAGRFGKEWYGWNFEAVYAAGYQVDYGGWEELYEIVR